MMNDEMYKKELQKVINKYKVIGVGDNYTHTEWLYSMFANRCKIADDRLILNLYGVSTKLNTANRPNKKQNFDTIFKKAIIQAMQNCLYMNQMHLEDLQKDCLTSLMDKL